MIIDGFLSIDGKADQSYIDYIYKLATELELQSFDGFVDVEIVDQLPGNAAGYCMGDEQTVLIEIALNDLVGRRSKRDIMIATAHEFIHAQQILSGRLENQGLTLRADDVTIDNVIHFDGITYINTPYNDQPWEWEAYDGENKLYRTCKK